MQIEEAVQTLGKAEKELMGLINEQKAKVEPVQKVYERNEEQIKRFLNLKKDAQNLYNAALTALQKCDNSETETAITHTHMAYRLIKEIIKRYTEASKIKDPTLREAMLTLLDKAYATAYTALETGRKHLSTLKQKPERDAYMSEFTKAVYGYD